MPNTAMPVRIVVALTHRRTGVPYELVALARHVDDDERLCIYKSTQPSVDHDTGHPLPAGMTWARSFRETAQKFRWTVEVKLK